MAVWDTDLWDVARWSTIAIDDMILSRPFASGHPVGIGDWRLTVEIALPEDPDSYWGVGEWDDATWGRLRWDDLTPQTRGLEWTTGSDEVYGRPRVGEAILTLDARDLAGYIDLDPWTADNAAYLAPGTVVRFGLISATATTGPLPGWLPMFTGITAGWSPVYVAKKADVFIDLTVHQTLRDLTQVDDLALSSPVGGSDDAFERCERLLSAAGWSYGFLGEAQQIENNPGAYPLQSTEMAQNRITEAYLTADSVDSEFRTARDGRAALTATEYIAIYHDADVSAWPLVDYSWYLSGGYKTPILVFDYVDGYTYAFGGGGYTALGVAYDVDSFNTANDDTNLYNRALIANVGQSQQKYQQTASVERYGPRTFIRNDLIGTNTAVADVIAQYTTIRRGLNTLRVDKMTVQTWQKNETVALAVAALEPGDRCYIYSPDGEVGGPRRAIYGFVGTIRHTLTPVPGKAVWVTDVRPDTRIVYNIPGAQLPSN